MTECADRSLLPGAPPPGAARAPAGAHAIDISCSRAFSLDPQILIDVTDPDDCPASVLPFLAWAYSVDAWDRGATEAQKRAVIKASIGVHRIKGTLQSIKHALTAAGYGDATIIEGGDEAQYDGSRAFDGTWNYGTPGSWAHWEIIVEASDSIPSADLIALLVQTAPARCRLVSVGYEKLFFRYNGEFNYDAERNYQRTYVEAA